MLEAILGVVFVAVLLFDIFQAVLVPRFTPASHRFAPFFIGKIAWPTCRKIATFINSETVLDSFLGAFAPMAFVMIFVAWMVSLTVAVAMIIHGLGNEFRPAINDFGTALYLAGTSVLTLGFGDIVAVSPLGRALVLAAGSTGITVVAVGVSYLFSMQQSVHSREVMVNTFQSRICTHASAVTLLTNYADLGIANQLPAQISEWELWTSQIVASHRAFPLLCYFRSGHMCVSWITVLGVMLDAANLLTTTINDSKCGHANFFLQIGSKLVNFFRAYLNLEPAKSCISREEFTSAYNMLKESGYPMHPENSAWEKFHITRSEYAPSLNALAYCFVCQTPGWISHTTADPETITKELLSSDRAQNALRR
ncbi:MAG: hypothetical protein K2X81_03165 [Candidatus Obscuribacterales bacterium]|nr:hypothetical protein [Candidatus Obscuribacterales bacterium]